MRIFRLHLVSFLLFFSQVGKGEMVSFHFPDGVEMEDMIKAVAAWSNRSFLINESIKGKIRIIAPKKMTEADAYSVFLSSLAQLGYGASEVGGITKIEKFEKTKLSSNKVFSEEFPESEEVVTYMKPIKRAQAEELKKAISSLTSSNSVLVSPSTNSLIFSDSGSRIANLVRIVDLLDVERQKLQVEIYPLQNTDPDAMVKYLAETIQKMADGKKDAECTFLPDVRTHSVIVAAPGHKIHRLMDVMRAMDTELRGGLLNGMKIHVVPLSFTEAKKLGPILESAKKTESKKEGASGASAGGTSKIVVDEGSNSLLIQAGQEEFKDLMALIKKLDQKRNLFAIEVHIVTLSSQSNFAFGTSVLAGASGAKNGKIIGGWEATQVAPLVVAGATAGAAGLSGSQQATQATSAMSQDLTFAIMPSQGITVDGVGTFTPAGLIKAMKNDSHSRLLSEPFILTLDAEQATFTAGQKVFYSVDVEAGLGNTNKLPKVEKEDVDLTLKVTPHGDALGRNIWLDIEITDDAVTAIAPNGYPLISKRKAKQMIQTQDGRTIFISGLHKKSRSLLEKKVPGFGDIPVIGYFLRVQEEVQMEEAVMIFLTSRFIGDPAEYQKDQQKKVDEISSVVVDKEARKPS
jgi:general secretion pathway protein D